MKRCLKFNYFNKESSLQAMPLYIKNPNWKNKNQRTNKTINVVGIDRSPISIVINCLIKETPLQGFTVIHLFLKKCVISLLKGFYLKKRSTLQQPSWMAVAKSTWLRKQTVLKIYFLLLMSAWFSYHQRNVSHMLGLRIYSTLGLRIFLPVKRSFS